MGLPQHVPSHVNIKDWRALQLMMVGASTIAVSDQHRPIRSTALRSPNSIPQPSQYDIVSGFQSDRKDFIIFQNAYLRQLQRQLHWRDSHLSVLGKLQQRSVYWTSPV